MCTKINNRMAAHFTLLLFALLLSGSQLFGQNNALHFDGDDDYITLTPISGFLPNSNFTVEMWFFSTATTGNGTCFGDFRRLFSMGNSGGGPSRLEVGECNGILSAFISGAGVVQSSPAINVRDNQWHCISATRTSGILDLFYDGVLVPGLNSLAAGSVNINLFRVGHWPGGQTLGQDWLGLVDEVKLWNIALSPAALTACNRCVLTGQEPGLIAYWRLDQGNPGLNNTGISTATDGSLAAANNGILTTPTGIPAVPLGFSRMVGSTSNFVNSTSPLVYPQYTNHHIKISNAQQNASLVGICNGTPVHMAIVGPNGVLAQAGGGATVVWQYSDDCITWTPIFTAPPVSSPSAVWSGFAFVTPPNDAATSVNCSGHPTGFENRCYRATISVTSGTTTCTYVAESGPLMICCPVSNAAISVVPAGPLCEMEVVNSFTATLSSDLPATATGSNVTVSWSVSVNGNTPSNIGGNQNSVVYVPNPTMLTAGSICFTAIVSNCICPAVTVTTCVRVDPKPVCGTITGSATPATLSPDPDGNLDHYLICPFDDAAVEIATPFTSCIPVWQFMFPSVPGVWTDLGTSNSSQNTNVLPHLKPAGSPYLWPPGETCILYRIKCVPLPLSPPSGCLPCYSNDVRICLKPAPIAPIITAIPSMFCSGSQSLLSVTNVQSGITYQWFCNGLSVGSGPTYSASKTMCYWVVASDGCQSATSNKECVKVCETCAIISCPVPICPCVGDAITLSAQDSFTNCGPIVSYSWSWVDINGGPVQTATTPTITDIPDAAGTIYTLTVTDSNGCTDTKTYTVIPCAP